MLDVRSEDGMGRYFVAKQALSAGQVVLQAKPTAAVLSDAFLASHCSGCFHPTDAPACSRCRTVRFCPNCAREGDGGVPHLRLHEMECDGIAALFANATNGADICGSAAAGTQQAMRVRAGSAAVSNTGSEWKVSESRTVRLLMRMLVLRALELSFVELAPARGPSGGPQKRKGPQRKKRKGSAEEGHVGLGGKGAVSEPIPDVPSYKEAVEALCDNSAEMPESLLQTFATLAGQAKRLLPSACRLSQEEAVQLVSFAPQPDRILALPDDVRVDHDRLLTLAGALAGCASLLQCTRAAECGWVGQRYGFRHFPVRLPGQPLLRSECDVVPARWRRGHCCGGGGAPVRAGFARSCARGAFECGILRCARAPKAPAKVPAEIVSLQLCVPPLRAPSVRQQG